MAVNKIGYVKGKFLVAVTVREAAKKVYFLSGRARKRGAKRMCHKGKKEFFNVRKKVPIAT